MKQQSKSELEALLNTNASVEAIQDNVRQIILDNVDVKGLTPPLIQAIKAVCLKVTIPLSMGIKTCNLPAVHSQGKEGIFSHIYNLAISVLIALLGVLIYSEILSLNISLLIAILAIYLAVSSFKLHHIHEKERKKKAEKAVEPTLAIMSTFAEMEKSINDQIISINRVITTIKELNKNDSESIEPLMDSHLEILKWMQRLYNNAVRLEKIGTERFREDISYILDLFNYDLVVYSPEESENFSVEHIKMENPEPNTVFPAIYHRNGENKVIVLKGKAFLPTV